MTSWSRGVGRNFRRRDPARRARPPLRVARRGEARGCARSFSPRSHVRSSRPRLPRCGRLDRRLYRSAARTRRAAGLCRGCRPRPAASEPAQAAGDRVHRRDRHSRARPGAACRAARLHRRRYEFISLKLVLPATLELAQPEACLLALIKPQFEAGRRNAKKGIVRDPLVHTAVCDDIASFVASLGWRVAGLLPSPIPGGDGNLEFFIAAHRP